MSNSWLEKISNGIPPSELLTREINEMGDYSGSELAIRFLDNVLADEDYSNPQIDPQDIYYPIWNWEKPDKRRVDGISSKDMDDWIIRILASWGKIDPTCDRNQSTE